MRQKSLLSFSLACLLGFALHPAAAHAINLGSAYRTPPGYGLTLYPMYYEADTKTDKDGHPAVTDLGLRKYGVAVKNAYQLGDFQLSAIVPVTRVEVEKINKHDVGLDDIQLIAGYFLPVEWANILPAVAVKLPTGSFDKNRAVNVGTGQTDLAVGVMLFKKIEPFTFDAGLKYNIRFRNPDNGFTPGNEFTAEGLVTLRLIDGLRIGPGVIYVIGEDNKQGGNTVADSGLMRLSAGGEIYCGSLEKVKASLSFYKDVMTRNTYEGYTVLGRIIFVF
jgi:hypothetical protein